MNIEPQPQSDNEQKAIENGENSELISDLHKKEQVKKLFVAITLSIIITAIVVGGVAYAWVISQKASITVGGKSSETPAPTIAATYSPSPIISGPQDSAVTTTKKTFSSSEYKFSFQYPASWSEPNVDEGYIDWVPYVARAPLILEFEPLGEEKLESYPSGTVSHTYYGFGVNVLPHAANFEKVMLEIRKDANAAEIIQTTLNGFPVAIYQVDGFQVPEIVEKTGGSCSYWKTAYIFGQQYDYLLYSACTADSVERTQTFDEILASFIFTQ